MSPASPAAPSLFQIDDAAPTRLRWNEPRPLPSDLELTSVLLGRPEQAPLPPEPAPRPPEPAPLSETRVQPLRPPPSTRTSTGEPNQPFALTRRTSSSDGASRDSASTWFDSGPVEVPDESGPRLNAGAPPEHVWRDESAPDASPAVLAHALVVAPPPPKEGNTALLAAGIAFAMSLSFAFGFAARLLGYI